MFKKQISFLLIIAMIIALCGCSSTEKGKPNSDFEIRSGIHFGDSIDEVKNKEQTLKFDRLEDSNNSLLFYGGLDNIEHATAIFFFDKNNVLNDFYYRFWNISEDPIVNEKIYKTVYNNCVKQFGESISNGKKYPVGKAVEISNRDMNEAKENGGSGKVFASNEWLVEGRNGQDAIKIGSAEKYSFEQINS